MNKTININLGGFFFHIDENAYKKLQRYLEAISRSLNDDPQGKNEIIADIEARISELLSERITDARQVVNESDIDEIIAIMGQPEDYAEAEQDYADDTYRYKRTTAPNKKLFRDGNDKFIGGVCSGIAHYLGIDVIWIRLAFIALLFGGGFSLIAYILLWILLPEAKTTAEKLQMEGEAVNIDNIEKKIRKEFENVRDVVKESAGDISNKISSVDYDKYGKKAKNGFQDFLDVIGKILLALFKVIGKIIGVLLVIIAAATLISLVIGLFSVGSLEFLNFDSDFVHYPPFFYNSSLPKWLLSLFLFILVGIPFLVLFVLGLRIISSNVKPFNKPTSLTLLGIWLVALLGIIFAGIEYGTSQAYKGTFIDKKEINLINTDTISVRMVNNDEIYYRPNLHRYTTKEQVLVNGEKKLYSNYINLDVERSESDKKYVVITKFSKGRSNNKADKNAKKLTYNYKIIDNQIALDAYFLSDLKNMHKRENINITIYVPLNSLLHIENSTESFLRGVKNKNDLYNRELAGHYFIMTKDGLNCTDCKIEKEIEEKDDNKKGKNNSTEKINSSSI